MKFTGIITILGAAFVLSACGGGSGSEPPPEPQPPPTPTIGVNVGLKQLIFSWPIRADVRWDATYYKLLENADGHSGFTQVGEDIPAEMGSVRRDIAVHLFDFANALYILEACNNYLCSRSTEVNVMNGMLDAIGYFKASDTQTGDQFGNALAISANGKTLAVAGAYGRGGAVYIFRSDGESWHQQTKLDTYHGSGAIALSADGNLLALGAPVRAIGPVRSTFYDSTERNGPRRLVLRLTSLRNMAVLGLRWRLTRAATHLLSVLRATRTTRH